MSAAAKAQPPASDRATVDRVALRFYAPETGGSRSPRFITERVLVFQARLEALGEEGANPDAPVLDRHVRAAVDRLMAEELLSSLAIERGAEPLDLPQVAAEIRAELTQRLGGADVLAGAAAKEGIAPGEVETMLLRQARAAIYIDRSIAPVLHPSDEQLREVWRTSSHPFKNRKLFEDAKVDLARWVIAQRVKIAEGAFLQTARTRVKLIAVTQ